uniref:Uncharacterized protein n=1 Tax=Ciona savignyi TaxID=51511 RepID=H2ZLN7_CIOSA
MANIVLISCLLAGTCALASAAYIPNRKVDCEVGEWGPYGSCIDLRNGNFIRIRSRSVVVHPSGGGRDCPPEEEITGCNMHHSPQRRPRPARPTEYPIGGTTAAVSPKKRRRCRGGKRRKGPRRTGSISDTSCSDDSDDDDSTTQTTGSGGGYSG